MRIDDTTLKALIASLNMRRKRQEILASNIANSETPGYKAKRLDFEEALSNAIDLDEIHSMKKGSSKHFETVQGDLEQLTPRVYEDPSSSVGEDGNSVNREQELARMAENKLMFDASVQLLNKKMGALKYVLNNEK